MKILLMIILCVFCTQIYAGKKKILKEIGIKKKCAASKVKSFSALLKYGCWRLSDDGTRCVFTSPCDGKNKKFNCKNSPNGFCKECNKCTCKGGQEICSVNVIACQDQLKFSLSQGCFVKWGKKCHFVYPCPHECKKGEEKCDECNYCRCKKGKWLCTKKGCGQCVGDCWRLTSNKQCVCRSACNGATPTHQPCQSGDKACSKCNGCQCGNNNLWICTLIGCLQPCPKDCWGPGATGRCECKVRCHGDNGFPKLAFCKPGQTACAACNTCRCLSPGQWGCTKKACQSCPSNCWEFKNNQCVCRDLCKASITDIKNVI